MIDKATGAGAAAVAAWFDWVAENVWGLEGDEDTPTSTAEPAAANARP